MILTFHQTSHPIRRYFALLGFFLGALLSFEAVSAQNCTDTTTIILVRHAEKILDQGSDPSLTEVGKIRAASLVQVLQDMPPSVLYASQYKRTQETVQPLADTLHLPITIRPIQGRTEDFASVLWQEIQNEHCGKTIVIAGHSNTNPVLLSTFCHLNAVINDSDYNQLFVATYKNGACSLIRAKY